MAFSRDGMTLAVGDGDRGSAVAAVAFSPDGTPLAAGDSAGHTYLWDVASGRRIATFTDPATDGIYSVTFAPDGRELAVGDVNSRTYLWDVRT
jgi:WD40 repeat protein